MQQGILFSQLDFEEEEDSNKAKAELWSKGVGPDIPDTLLAELSKEERRKAVKASKKSATMSLDQFQASEAMTEVDESMSVSPTSPWDKAVPQSRTPAHPSPTPPQDKAVGPQVQGPGPAGDKLAPTKVVKPEVPGNNFFNQIEEAAVVAINRCRAQI